jgi:tetratricopeptide (TPR) repeat protein
MHFWKGIVLMMVQGDVENASLEAERTLAIDPRFPAGFPHFAGPARDWIRGDISVAHEGYSQLFFNDMQKLGPLFQVAIRTFISRFFFFSQDNDLVLRLLETSEGMLPRLSDSRIAGMFLLERALVHEELGNLTQSRKLLRELADSSQGLSRVEALGWLGIQLARQGNAREAEVVGKALREEQREIPAGFFAPPIPGERERAQRAFTSQILGEAETLDGDFGKGIEHFLKVVRAVPPRGSLFSSFLNPRLFLVANESLARAYKQIGEDKNSIEAYRSIIEHKNLLVGTPAAGRIWMRALRGIIPLLEKEDRLAEAESYRELLRENIIQPEKSS